MDVWIGRDGERHGPYKEEDVRQWLRSGQVSGDDLAWYDGLADWQPLSVLFPDERRSAATAPGDTPYSAPAAPLQGLPQTNTAALEDYAGFWKRLAAFIIDTILLYVVFRFIGMLFGFNAIEEAAQAAMKQEMLNGVSFMHAWQHTQATLWPYNLINTVLGWLYFAICESSAWQATVGKLALGIRVTDMQGSRISFLRAVGRYAAKFLSYIILLIGFLMVAFTRRKQGLHDLVAGTLVLNGRASEFKDAAPKSSGNSFNA
ncbi:RDD family protein [Fulvimonas sp. R45]|uniref:RDD family protein n=1 Tax=Fulvimonas sp. R45 TaxID=3045937 RepID=UPI0026605517|nr:RDD family protein [Fulvimonas sp. R45]MDO1530341.1 RDD family protein [Fulvimonas sp. R45]